MHLRAENLHVWRGERHVLRGVDLDVRAGQVLQVSGPNGSGKTSLLKTLCGLLHPEAGRIVWNGRDTKEDWAEFHSHLAYVGHDVPLKPELTVRENLSYWTGLRRVDASVDIEDSLRVVGAEALRERFARTLSAGQKRRVALAGVLALAAPLWLLDEPTTHLDSEGQALIARLIDRHAARGGLVIAAIHQPLAIADDRARALDLAA
ncbi:MAG: heme ABC exporter ATP-binding protein CcmA [Gammaproteobacteria bacterium]